MRDKIHRKSRNNMREMRRLVFFDERGSFKQPLSFIKVNINSVTLLISHPFYSSGDLPPFRT